MTKKPIPSYLKIQRYKLATPVIVLIILVAILGTFSVGFFVGKQTGIRTVVPEGEGRLTGIGSLPPARLVEDVDFRLFWQVWNEIKDNYYRRPVSEKDLFYGALSGLVSGTGDAYSTFFDPGETELFNQELEGSFEGVGMEIGIRDNQLQVIAPLPETPAERAGIQAGDKIFLIDGEDTTNMTVEDAVFRIRGEKGTEVVLTVGRNGLTTVEEIPVVRDTIKIHSLKWEIDEDKIMIVDLVFFNEDSGPLFEEAVQEALTSDVDGIILDLRNNPGGLLHMAISIASEWTGTSPVVLEQVQNVKQPLSGRGKARLNDIPTVILVNGGSASASEIVAGALQDYGLATIVGGTTFGKGSVQDYQPLPDGSSLKITIAEWLTPNERFIHEVGIEPDEVIEFTFEQFEAGEDPQMDAAIEIINGTYVRAETE